MGDREGALSVGRWGRRGTGCLRYGRIEVDAGGRRHLPKASTIRAGSSVGLPLRHGGSRVWLWDTTRGLVDLNTRISGRSGWLLQEATSINDRGVIVGRGQYHGERAGFLLRPVDGG